MGLYQAGDGNTRYETKGTEFFKCTASKNGNDVLLLHTICDLKLSPNNRPTRECHMSAMPGAVHR
jgi:hypothetical protein